MAHDKLAITAVDLYAAVSRGVRSRRNSAVSLTAAVTVTGPRQQVYERWRQLDGLPAFMAHLDDVTVTGPRTSHWRATAPFGAAVETASGAASTVTGEARTQASAVTDHAGQASGRVAGQVRPGDGG